MRSRCASETGGAGIWGSRGPCPTRLRHAPTPSSSGEDIKCDSDVSHLPLERLGRLSLAGYDLEIAKNKHGPRDEHVYLHIDRRSQTLTETDYEPPPEDDGETRRTDRALTHVEADAATVLTIVTAEPGIGTRELYAAAKAATGIGRARVDAAVRALGDRIERRPGPRDSRVHYPAGAMQ
jgi:hypothetical protein